MVASKKVELTGTSSIYNCDSLLVYNTETFKDLDMIDNNMRIGREIASIIANPSISHINDIYNTLISMEVFDIIIPNNEGYYIFNNDNLNYIRGEGFDTIIFLLKGEILGYIQLLDPCGYYKFTRDEKFDISRSYTMRQVVIGISSEEENKGVITDQDLDEDGNFILNRINLLTDISLTSEKSILGKHTYEYPTAKELLSKTYGYGVYNINVNSILKENTPKNIFTDTTIFHIDGNKIYSSKLGIHSNVQLDSIYYSYKHTQVGLYKGDISLYIWNDDCQYSIFSLTKTLGDLFKEKDLIHSPCPYTIPRKGVSNTEIYTIPILDEFNEQYIKYFSGRYAVVKQRRGELKEYLFDIELQTWIKPGSDFLLDRFDINEKVTIFENNSWITLKDSIKDIPEISNIYINNQAEISSNSGQVVGKFGDWIVFYNISEESYVYTNMTKAIKMSIKEEDPIVINNQVLMTKTKTSEGYLFTLYDSPGYYITPIFYDSIKKGNDISITSPEIYTDHWILQDNLHSLLIPEKGDVTSLLSKSIFSPFRRNVIPETLEGLEIIGAIGGIIFYRIGNIINYL